MNVFLPLILLIFAVNPAFAAPKAAPEQPTVRPVYELDGAFGFCIADQNYADGRKMTVAFSPEKQINLGVTIPKGHFKIGSRYDLSLILGDEEPRKVRAEALDEETLLLQMGSSLSFRKKLASSQSFKVGAGGTLVTFELAGMNQLLDDLKKCTEEKRGTKDDKAAKIDHAMPKPLVSLLLTAGITDITPMSMDKIPAAERPADYIWQSGNILGGVRERTAPKDKDLSDLIGLHMQGLKEKCTGVYRGDIGREQHEGDMSLRIADATCGPKKKESGKAVYVAILFYMTKTGTFTVFTHEGLEDYKAEAVAARDKLAKTLLSLAKG